MSTHEMGFMLPLPQPVNYKSPWRLFGAILCYTPQRSFSKRTLLLIGANASVFLYTANLRTQQGCDIMAASGHYTAYSYARAIFAYGERTCADYTISASLLWYNENSVKRRGLTGRLEETDD